MGGNRLRVRSKVKNGLKEIEDKGKHERGRRMRVFEGRIRMSFNASWDGVLGIINREKENIEK